MFGSLKSKCRRWQDQGLIGAEQTAAILAFEHGRRKGKLVRDLTGVAVLAIVLGLALLVGMNWAAISPTVKLAGHFILNLAAAGMMLRIDGQKHPVAKDAAVAGLFGLFLTFIALIGQVYQLHGDLHVTMLFWTAICTPFLLYYGRSYVVAVPWLVAVLFALYMNIGAIFDRDEKTMILVGTLMSFYLPMGLVLLARLPVLIRMRPGFSGTFMRMGLILPALFATAASFLFYDGSRYLPDATIQMVMMSAGLLLILVVFRPRPGADESAGDLRAYLLGSGLVFMLPFALPDVGHGVLAAAVFILYWIFIAWLGARMQSAAITDWAIRLVVLRLFTVYLEVFGGMLMNGIGLIVSGVVLLLILRNLNRIVAFGRRLVRYEIG